MTEELKTLDSIALKVTGFASKIDQEEAIDEFHTIRKALKEKEKLEKATEICKNKQVDFYTLNRVNSCREYNIKMMGRYAYYENKTLKSEEYDLLKEILK